MMEPYEALESAFLYRRLSEAARQSRAIHWQIYRINHGGSVEPDQADIDSVRQLTQNLMSEAAKSGILQTPKP